MHDEGGAVWMFFTLLFHDVIFSNVADAFHWRQQTQPLDFFSLEFYSRRKEQVDARLGLLRSLSAEVRVCLLFMMQEYAA